MALANGGSYNGGGYIRVIAVRTGTFYGQAMTAGDTDRVRGRRLQRAWADGGPRCRPRSTASSAAAVAAAADDDFADGLPRTG